MDPLAVIRRESELFYTVAAGADPGTTVPSCPEWSVADLVWHLGQVHWFWGTDVEIGAADPESVEALKPQRPGTYGDLVAWGRAQCDRLVAILEKADDATAVWTWSPPHQTVGFIRRHQVQEAAVHRWDIQRAAGGPGPDAIDPEVASDSIDEVLAVTLPWRVIQAKPLTGSVHIHCTDTEGEWFVHPDGRVEPIHAKGVVALRGPASDLLLALYQRIPLDGLDVIGDVPLGRELVERLNTE